MGEAAAHARSQYAQNPMGWTTPKVIPTFTTPYEDLTEPLFSHMLYLNGEDVVPGYFRKFEFAYLFLQLLSLLHAMKNRNLHLWFGFVLFGLVQEILGYVLNTHIHAQFTVQLFEFLPLKEILWYPLNLYPAWLAVRQFNIVNERNEVSYWGNAVAFCLVNHLNNVPYDFIGGRVAIDFWYLNKFCPVANFDIDAWHGGVPPVYYGWLAMGLGAGAVAALAERKEFSGLKYTLALGLSSILSSFFWIPYNFLKLASCSIPSDKTPLEVYFHCVRYGTITDDQIYLGSLIVLVVMFAAAMRKRNGINRTSSPGIMICVVGYWATLGYVYLTREWENWPFAVLCLLGTLAISLHFFLHMKFLAKRQRRKGKTE